MFPRHPSTSLSLLALAFVLLSLSAAAQPRPAGRAMAVTFDDLPYVETGRPDLPAARRATSKILRALSARRAPAVAFVNEAQLQVTGEVDARIALLTRWVAAGAVLGNHTYSHQDFNRLTAQEFEDEIIRGAVVTPRLMEARGPYTRYFRHPFTHTGDTRAKKEAVEEFLAARGYRVAPHTIDPQDYVFNEPYARALRAGDRATAARLRAAYVDFTLAATEFAERISPRIFGRGVPQTLLLHANDITADCLDELLRRLAARGYRFITLDEAMRDPAYQTKDTYVTAAGPSWLWRWAKSKGLDVSFAGDPEPPPWVSELASQGARR